MTFDEVKDGETFTDIEGKPYQKVKVYAARNKITSHADLFNAISLWDFGECYFRDEEMIYDPL